MSHTLSQTVPSLLPRDFSADVYNFNQIAVLLNNLNYRIGIPFSAMLNIGLNLPQVLEINPLDLSLLPASYSFSYDASHSANPSSPFQNYMVELDEEKITILCAEAYKGNPQWRLMKECPKQKETLMVFLRDIRAQGTRLAVPKERLERARVVDWDMREGVYSCLPQDAMTCAPRPRSLQVQEELQSDLYTGWTKHTLLQTKSHLTTDFKTITKTRHKTLTLCTLSTSQDSGSILHPLNISSITCSALTNPLFSTTTVSLSLTSDQKTDRSSYNATSIMGIDRTRYKPTMTSAQPPSSVISDTLVAYQAHSGYETLLTEIKPYKPIKPPKPLKPSVTKPAKPSFTKPSKSA